MLYKFYQPIKSNHLRSRAAMCFADYLNAACGNGILAGNQIIIPTRIAELRVNEICPCVCFVVGHRKFILPYHKVDGFRSENFCS